ncbi:MAG: hypothetical protein U9Q07_00895 [Planctomycetota bacterium]|nr:hypothetical protein [Planctomycetota bacterium]
MRITANRITALLAEKHSRDCFVPQCKTGGSWGADFQIMDAWAMAKSWAHPRVVGYEIKVTRADFLGDNKWRGYLPYCNEFYWVAPAGVVDLGELAEGVGLLTVAKTGTRLFTKRKAAYRDIEIDQDILRYVLMHRVAIGDTSEGLRPTQRDHWRQWLAQKKADRKMGHEVSRALRQQYERDVEEVRKKIGQLESIRRAVEAMGICLDDWNCGYEVKKQIERVRAFIPPETRVLISRLAADLQALMAQIKANKES